MRRNHRCNHALKIKGCTRQNRTGVRKSREFRAPGTGVENLLRMAMDSLTPSARAHDLILKVPRIIADLGDSAQIAPDHIAGAIQFCTLDRKLWR